MRNITENDKRIADILIEKYSNKYGFRIYDVLKDFIDIRCKLRIWVNKIEPDTNKKIYHFTVTCNKNDVPTITNRINTLLYQFNDSIDFLLKEQFIEVVNEASFDKVILDCSERESLDDEIFIFNDLIRVKTFDRFSYVYQVHESLNDLKEHNFVLKEERHYASIRKHNLWTRIIACVAVGFSLISIFLSSRNTYKTHYNKSENKNPLDSSYNITNDSTSSFKNKPFYLKPHTTNNSDSDNILGKL